MEVVNLLSAILSTFGSNRFNFVRHPDIGLNIEQLTFKYGYPLESHKLYTEDGYFLKTHRIPHGKFSNNTNPHPILLVHGTCGCADTFLANSENSLAYYLADRGFDVWLMNDRGNKYSRKHRYLDPNTDRNFWEYSWHEIGIYDIPANIDHILKTTNRHQLSYLGHSQGTTQYFVLLSERPDYNEKINVGILMAPSAFYEHTNSINKITAKNHKLFQEVMDYFGIYELFPNEMNNVVGDVGRFLCSDQNILVDVCNLVFEFGTDSGQLNGMATQLLLNGSPARCAVKQLTHYFQVINSGIFRQYDHGLERNLQTYGSEFPRNYSFGNINAPTIFMYAELDGLCAVKDVERIISLTKRAETIKINNFNHIDFIIGKDAKEWALGPMLELVEKYLG